MDWYWQKGKQYFKKDHTYVINFDTNQWYEPVESFDWEWYEGVYAISNRRMTYLNGLVTKYFPKGEHYKEEIKILNKINPNYIIDYIIKEDREYYTYKFINGYSGKQYIQDNESSDLVKWTIANFFKNTYQEILPYAKYTYQLSDVIADKNTMTLIDWEDIYLPTDMEKDRDLIKINKLFNYSQRVSVGGSYEYWNGTIEFNEL